MRESAVSLETSPQQITPRNSNAAAPKGEASNQPAEPKAPRGLAEMFGDPQDPSSLEIALEDEDTADDPDKPVDSIDRLMKRYKLTEEQAYALKVPMADGEEPLTLGQLKDKVRSYKTFETDVTEFEERRIQQEGDLLRAQTQLRSVIDLIPKEAIKPEVLKALAAMDQTRAKREKQLTLGAIPAWRDETRRTAEIEGMGTLLEDYGLGAGFLETILDHRAIKLIRDFYLMRSRVQKSLAEVRDPARRPGQRPSSKSRPAQRPITPSNRTANRAPTQQDRLVALFSSKE